MEPSCELALASIVTVAGGVTYTWPAVGEVRLTVGAGCAVVTTCCSGTTVMEDGLLASPGYCA